MFFFGGGGGGLLIVVMGVELTCNALSCALLLFFCCPAHLLSVAFHISIVIRQIYASIFYDYNINPHLKLCYLFQKSKG